MKIDSVSEHSSLHFKLDLNIDKNDVILFPVTVQSRVPTHVDAA